MGLADLRGHRTVSPRRNPRSGPCMALILGVDKTSKELDYGRFPCTF
jgi:hypothetical protein